MSLDWNVTEVKDYEKVTRTTDGNMNPKTNALIWETMVVGICDISEKNIREWMFRMEMAKRLSEDGDSTITVEDLRQHIGLRTNVTTETRHAWLKRWLKSISFEIERGIREQLQPKEIQHGKT